MAKLHLVLRTEEDDLSDLLRLMVEGGCDIALTNTARSCMDQLEIDPLDLNPVLKAAQITSVSAALHRTIWDVEVVGQTKNYQDVRLEVKIIEDEARLRIKRVSNE